MAGPGMKCTSCRAPANHRFPSHHVHFCDECLGKYVRKQVEKAIRKFSMLRYQQRVLVAVSGGKDSLLLWQVLGELGYEVEALHLGLGLGEFSAASLESCQAMARRLGSKLNHCELKDLTGFEIADIVDANRRQFCSVCGIMKRHFVNRKALELGFDTVAMGQHLDDEASRLLGNMIHGRAGFLARQWPVLEGLDGKFVRKVKPMVRLTGDETGALARVRGLPVCEQGCTRSRYATLTYYQEAMDLLEQRMPGTKRALYYGFLDAKDGPPPGPRVGDYCPRCGAPTFAELCNCCRLLERAELAKARLRNDLDRLHT